VKVIAVQEGASSWEGATDYLSLPLEEGATSDIGEKSDWSCTYMVRAFLAKVARAGKARLFTK
jgi:hypothetical protein